MEFDSKEGIPAINSVRILLVGDVSGSLNRIHQLLSESDLASCYLDSATTSVEIANRLRENSHDVCIIDSVELKAEEFMAQAKSFGCSIPVIVVTSDSSVEILEAIHAGVADCLLRDQLTISLLEQSICRVIREACLALDRLENERRYFGLVENAKDIIYTHDLQGNYKSANKAAEGLTGYTQKELMCMNATQVVAKEYIQLSRQMTERKLKSQQETSYELDLVCKDGHRVPVEVNSHLIYREGKPVAVQGIARDITERRLFEGTLRDSEQRYWELFANANDLVYVHDLEGNFTSLNKVGELITGYSFEEALTMNIAQVVVPEHLQTARSMMVQKTVLNSPTLYELDIVSKAGRQVSLEVSTRLIYRDGVAIAIQGIGRDITQRVRSELERRVILEIIQSVNLTSNLDDLLRLIYRALGKTLYAENCFVALHDKETGLFRKPFFVDKLPNPHPPEMKRGATAYVFRTGQPLLANRQVFQQLVNAGEIELVGKFAPSWLGVPLNTPSETIGVLVVQHYGIEDAYTQRDLEFLTSVGGQIALAIERKRTEEALRRSEEEYREIFDNATMGIYRSNREGRLVTANRALARILGYSSVAELLQCNLTTDIYATSDESARLIAQGFTSGAAEGLEVQWKKKNGSPIWIELNAIAIKDGSDNTIFFDGFVHEISERKVAETALRESEERYQRLVELSPDGIFVHSEGRITFVNSSAVRLIGARSAKGIIGRSVYDFIDPSQHLRLTERVTKLQNGELVAPMELKGRRFDGTELECEVLSVPMMLNEKRAVQVVIRDITERKQAEQALDEANRRALADYERLVERMAVLGQSLGNARELKAILRAVRDFTIVSVPCDGMVITLYEPEKALRRCVYLWADGAEVETDELLEFPVGDGMTGRALRTGMIVIENNYEESLVHSHKQVIGNCADGSIPRSALSAPMTVMGRTVGCVEIQSYDLNAYAEEHKTAMRMAANLAANAVENVALMEREQDQAEQLRQSQKMEAIGQLAGGVAHDFNNLLTAISGYSELGLQSLNNGDPLRRNLQEISKASSRATSLTRQLLAFSRKQMLQAKVIDLNDVVDDMDKMLRRLIGEDINLIILFNPSPCLVKADQGQIEQVILNLAVNARDAMPVGGKLTIETGRVCLDETHAGPRDAVQPGTYVMLAVSDTGAGIDHENQKRVFEPFFTTKEVGKGTGLGLSTVYGIVKQSGGNISVYSEPGKGATFKVYLPVFSESADSGDAKTNMSELRPGRETVLLVEDEEMVRNLSCEILEMNGYRVLAAANGEEACRVCEVHSGEIHLMITDVVMPHMSGREVAERVARTRPEMRVLYMSGYTDDAIVSHGVLDHKIPFLQKPFTPDSLARKVREVLEQVPLTVG
jgi:PAS domain S-box-containing protein